LHFPPIPNYNKNNHLKARARVKYQNFATDICHTSFDKILWTTLISHIVNLMVVPWFRRLVNGFSPLRPGFNCRVFSVVGFVVDEVELGDVELKPRYICLPLQVFISSALHNYHQLLW